MQFKDPDMLHWFALYLGIDSESEGGERVEQPGEGGGAEDPLDKLDDVLSTALNNANFLNTWKCFFLFPLTRSLI